uniref:hypothetical protein n=1 Tax=Brucella intermedia TaxID=94625 RepID=UPI00235F63D6
QDYQAAATDKSMGRGRRILFKHLHAQIYLGQADVGKAHNNPRCLAPYFSFLFRYLMIVI